MTTDTSEPVRVWLVERTYSDDEQNIIILTYATPDGTQYHRKERAVTLQQTTVTKAAVDVDPDNLGAVSDPETRERYRTEAARMAERYDPGESI